MNSLTKQLGFLGSRFSILKNLKIKIYFFFNFMETALEIVRHYEEKCEENKCNTQHDRTTAKDLNGPSFLIGQRRKI